MTVVVEADHCLIILWFWVEFLCALSRMWRTRLRLEATATRRHTSVRISTAASIRTSLEEAFCHSSTVRPRRIAPLVRTVGLPQNCVFQRMYAALTHRTPSTPPHLTTGIVSDSETIDSLLSSVLHEAVQGFLLWKEVELTVVGLWTQASSRSALTMRVGFIARGPRKWGQISALREQYSEKPVLQDRNSMSRKSVPSTLLEILFCAS